MTIVDVAKWHLTKQPMTHKKLQKMCYYSQAWHCALLEKPLFDEDFEAWVHGPVCPPLYSIYRDYGWQDIEQSTEPVNIKNAQTEDLLETVFNTYSKYSGDELENMSHRESPWLSARGELEEWQPSTTVIDKNAMREFYLKEYQRWQND